MPIATPSTTNNRDSNNHRCQDKWRFGGNRFVDSLANEELCFQLVRELASKWSGILWKNEQPSEAEQQTIESLTGQPFLYRRVGNDERIIKLDIDRATTDGSAECERQWHILTMSTISVL
jgi:hypothetical protein